MSIYTRRWDRARAEMARQGIDYLFLAPSSDLYYMSGYGAKPSERITCLVLGAQGEAHMVLPAFEAMRLHPDLRQDLHVHTWVETDDPLDKIAALVGGSPRRGAAGDQMWSIFLLGLQARLPGWQWEPAAKVMPALRMVKDETEVSCLREAQEMAGKALAMLLQRGLAGKTERQVAQELTALRQQVGLDTNASFCIVGAGENGASPHHMNSDRVIRKGEAVVIDFGGRHMGYQADLTRTPHVGPATEEFRRVYHAVLRANEAAFAATRPGATCESIDRAGRDQIDAAGYGQYFIHRLGHGIGLDGHEEPYMVQGNRLPLAAGMTFTDEPGIYLPGRFGVRIEDVIVVTPGGGEKLTGYPREIEEVD